MRIARISSKSLGVKPLMASDASLASSSSLARAAEAEDDSNSLNCARRASSSAVAACTAAAAPLTAGSESKCVEDDGGVAFVGVTITTSMLNKFETELYKGTVQYVSSSLVQL